MANTCVCECGQVYAKHYSNTLHIQITFNPAQLYVVGTMNVLGFSQLKTALTLQFKRKRISFSNNKCSVRIN